MCSSSNDSVRALTFRTSSSLFSSSSRSIISLCFLAYVSFRLSRFHRTHPRSDLALLNSMPADVISCSAISTCFSFSCRHSLNLSSFFCILERPPRAARILAGSFLASAFAISTAFFASSISIFNFLRLFSEVSATLVNRSRFSPFANNRPRFAFLRSDVALFSRSFTIFSSSFASLTGAPTSLFFTSSSANFRAHFTAFSDLSTSLHSFFISFSSDSFLSSISRCCLINCSWLSIDSSFPSDSSISRSTSVRSHFILSIAFTTCCSTELIFSSSAISNLPRSSFILPRIFSSLLFSDSVPLKRVWTPSISDCMLFTPFSSHIADARSYFSRVSARIKIMSATADAVLSKFACASASVRSQSTLRTSRSPICSTERRISSIAACLSSLSKCNTSCTDSSVFMHNHSHYTNDPNPY